MGGGLGGGTRRFLTTFMLNTLHTLSSGNEGDHFPLRLSMTHVCKNNVGVPTTSHLAVLASPISCMENV